MAQIYRVTGQGWMGLTFCGLLAVGTFAFGYWQGQRAQAAKDSAEPKPSSQLMQPSAWGHPSPSIYAAQPPLGATPEMKEFMENRAQLADAFAKLRSQSANGSPNSQLMAQFKQQNDALIKRQLELSRILAQQQGRLPTPSLPLKVSPIPPNATPQQKAYLSARDQLLRDEIAFFNEHKSDDPAARQMAMLQWRQQHVDKIKQLQAMSHSLTENIPPTPTTNLPAVHP